MRTFSFLFLIKRFRSFNRLIIFKIKKNFFNCFCQFSQSRFGRQFVLSTLCSATHSIECVASKVFESCIICILDLFQHFSSPVYKQKQQRNKNPIIDRNQLAICCPFPLNFMPFKHLGLSSCLPLSRHFVY